MRFLQIIVVSLCACGAAASPPSPSPQPPTAPASAPSDPPTNVGCSVLPMPSKPGHTTVEPDDMACFHGEIAYDCPIGVAAPVRCHHSTATGWWDAVRTWCCPSA